MTRLVLINGAPGSGKSTAAHLLSRRLPRAVALDIDVLKHGLPEWATDQDRAGLRARQLTLSLAEDHLTRGRDVIVGQYLGRPDFIEELQGLAATTGSVFAEFVLVCEEHTLRARLEQRARTPERPEHEVNSRLVTADDVPGLVDRMERLRQRRPEARPIDASGTPEATVDHLLAALLGNDAAGGQ